MLRKQGGHFARTDPDEGDGPKRVYLTIKLFDNLQALLEIFHFFFCKIRKIS